MATATERLDTLELEIQTLKDEFKIRNEELLALKEKLLTIKEIMRDYIDDVYRLKLSRFDDSSDDDTESDDESDDDATYTSDPEVEVDLDETPDEPEQGIEQKPETVFEF